MFFLDAEYISWLNSLISKGFKSQDDRQSRLKNHAEFHINRSAMPKTALKLTKRLLNIMHVFASKQADLTTSPSPLILQYITLNVFFRIKQTGFNAEIQDDDVIKWKRFLRYWPFVRGIHRSPVNSPHKGQWRRALVFSLICAWINGSVNNGEAGDLRRHRGHYGVTIMTLTN